jgi:hypothetical protein
MCIVSTYKIFAKILEKRLEMISYLWYYVIDKCVDEEK